MEAVEEGLKEEQKGLKEAFNTLREIERRRCKDDLFYLARFVLGKALLVKGADRMDWHHKQLCEELMQRWRARKDQVTKTSMKVEWPRGTLKSTICTVFFPVWVLLNDPDTRILIESETATNALRFLALIKACFESKHFQYLFGVMYNQRHRWNLEELTLIRKQDWKEPSIDVGGIEVEKTGQHYDLYIGDDLQGKTNSQTRDQIEKVIGHAKSVYSLMNPQAMLLFPGTRWAHSDLGGYMDELNAEDDEMLRPRGIHVSRYTCWAEKEGKLMWGQPEFPTLLPVEELNDMRAKQGPYVFSCNYLLDPTTDDTSTFRSKWLRYHNFTVEQLVDMGCEFWVSVDPAGENEFRGSDFTAIVVVAISPRYDIYVVEVIRQAGMSRKQLADTLFSLAEQYKVRAIGMEAILKYHELYTWLKMERTLRQKTVIIRDFKNSRQVKESRIRGLQPVVEAGKFFIRREHKHLEDELLRHPRGKNDDCLDAAAYTLEFMAVPIEQQPKKFWEKDENWAQNWRGEGAPPSPNDVRIWKFMDSMGGGSRNRHFGRPI